MQYRVSLMLLLHEGIEGWNVVLVCVQFFIGPLSSANIKNSFFCQIDLFLLYRIAFCSMAVQASNVLQLHWDMSLLAGELITGQQLNHKNYSPSQLESIHIILTYLSKKIFLSHRKTFVCY